MRRVLIILVGAAVVVLAAVMLFRKPKVSSARRARTTQTDSATTTGQALRASARRGKTTGAIQAKTKEERIAERKRLREAEQKRRRELRRQEREKRRMLKYARSRRGIRKSSSRKGSYYMVKAIVSLGEESYALIDSRRVKIGDVVMGRKIVAIHPDRIEVEAFGRRTVVRVGESLLPPTYSTRERKRI